MSLEDDWPRSVALATFRFDAMGGAVQVVRNLAHFLGQRGIRVIVITSADVPAVERTEQDGVIVYRFRPKNLYWVGDKDRQPAWNKAIWQLVDIWNPHTFLVVRKILETEQPDLVHVHKLRGLSPSIWQAATAADIPCIVQSCHDYELVSPEGALASRIGMWAQQARFPFNLYQYVRGILSRSVHAVSAPTQFVLDQMLDKGLFPNAINCVIPNSHGRTRSQLSDQRRAETTNAKKRRILYMGRLTEDKGIADVCRLFRDERGRWPDLQLRVAGWGPMEKVLRDEFDGVDNIEFLGFVEGREKQREFEQADFVVVPSHCEEVFGLVVVEAYSYGTPVIAYSVGGLPEVILDGETGYLVPPGSEDGLARLIDRWMNNRLRIESMGKRCLELAGKYTVEAVGDAYLHLYNRSQLSNRSHSATE